MPPAARRWCPRPRHVSAFWVVAFAFLIVMAFATLPSPLYGLYRERDGLSTFTITIVYAIWAARHDRHSDRRSVHRRSASVAAG